MSTDNVADALALVSNRFDQAPEQVQDRAHELGCCRFLSKPCTRPLVLA
jgi:hypothetical protein